jgi:hypothetical protein
MIPSPPQSDARGRYHSLISITSRSRVGHPQARRLPPGCPAICLARRDTTKRHTGTAGFFFAIPKPPLPLLFFYVRNQLIPSCLLQKKQETLHLVLSYALRKSYGRPRRMVRDTAPCVAGGPTPFAFFPGPGVAKIRPSRYSNKPCLVLRQARIRFLAAAPRVTVSNPLLPARDEKYLKADLCRLGLE